MAEAGGNKGEGERIDELAGPSTQIHIPNSVEDDINHIKKIIQEQLNSLELYLVDKKVCSPRQAELVASRILLHGEQLRANGPDDPDDPDPDDPDYDPFRVKIPSFLFIIAPDEEANGLRREKEIKQRIMEAQNFMKVYGITDYPDLVVVDDFKEMENKVKTVISRSRVSEIPFVVFLGHGEECGEVSFFWESVDPIKILSALYECHKTNRPLEMPLGQLRVIFSQCHAHEMLHHDPNEPLGTIKHTGNKITRDGIEYYYLTSPTKPKTSSSVRECPLLLEELTDMLPSDVHPHLHIDDKFFDVVLEELLESKAFEKEFISKWLDEHAGVSDQSDQADLEMREIEIVHDQRQRISNKKQTLPKALEELKQSKEFKESVHQYCVLPCVRDDDGCGTNVSEKMREEIKTHRKKMKRFLSIRYPESESTKEDRFNQFKDGQIEFDEKEVDSKEDLMKTIKAFINLDCVMPVVLVYGAGSLDEAGILSLKFSDTEKVTAKAIFDDSRIFSTQLRMVFSCHIDGKPRDKWLSNAIPPDVELAEHKELQDEAWLIVGNGPLNEIELPTPTLRPNDQETEDSSDDDQETEDSIDDDQKTDRDDQETEDSSDRLKIIKSLNLL